MRIDEIIATGEEPVFSFEFYPPKTDEGELSLRATLEALRRLEPDFVSVTYGAGGSSRGRTVELTKWIKQDLGIEAMAHLSCVGSTREELAEILDGMAAAGIENVLALRGDPPRGETRSTGRPGGLQYSTELATLIDNSYDFSVGAACFPEVHPEAPDLAHDLRFLKAKVDSGASFLITQLFFDNELYFRLSMRPRSIGIEVPIIPGVMPITDASQITPPIIRTGKDLDAVKQNAVAVVWRNCPPRSGRVHCRAYNFPAAAVACKHARSNTSWSSSRRRLVDHYFGTYPTAANTSGQKVTPAAGTPSVNGLTGTLVTANPNGTNRRRYDPRLSRTC